MTSVEKLRAQAAKARRLAAGLTDPLTRDALNAYADEAEAHADAVEARDKGLLTLDDDD